MVSNEFDDANIKEKRKRERDHNEIRISKKRGGYGEIGRRYGLNWIEP